MKDIKIINLTPHDIMLWDKDNQLITYMSEGILRVKENLEEIGNLNGFPIYKKKFGGFTGYNLPDVKEGVYYIVSLPVLLVSNRTDFISTNDLVRDNKGRIIGCRSFYTL